MACGFASATLRRVKIKADDNSIRLDKMSLSVHPFFFFFACLLFMIKFFLTVLSSQLNFS